MRMRAGRCIFSPKSPRFAAILIAANEPRRGLSCHGGQRVGTPKASARPARRADAERDQTIGIPKEISATGRARPVPMQNMTTAVACAADQAVLIRALKPVIV